MYYSNGNKHTITSYMNTNLWTVDGYDKRTTEYLIKSFEMKEELSKCFRRIGGVIELTDASVLIGDIFAKGQNLIHPPFLPNIKFAKFAITNELICFGSLGFDPDNFKVNDMTFYIYKGQLSRYYQ